MVVLIGDVVYFMEILVGVCVYNFNCIDFYILYEVLLLFYE